MHSQIKTQEILIITGGSRGIGKGIIDAYLLKNVTIFSISRTNNPELSKKGVTQIELDLTEIDQIDIALRRIFDLLESYKISKITLINNAGTLGKIGTLDRVGAETIATAVQLNVTAPLVLSSLFIRYLKKWNVNKSIINITSGAATKPYFGWSVYCSTKAALNMMSQAIAVEQLNAESGVKVLAIAPGVVDTDMQTEIRNSKKEDFEDVDRFIALKNANALNDTFAVGLKIFELDHDDNLKSGSILRVEIA